MAVYSRENLFAGREPEKPEDRVKSFNLMRGASITTPLPASLLCRATWSRVAMRLSRDGEQPLKQWMYTTLLFHDRHAYSTATPLERSKKLVSMLNQAVGDLAATGSVSLLLDRTGNQHCAGPMLPTLAESYKFMPEVIAALRNGTRDLELETVMQWVYMCVTMEVGAFELPDISLHLQCLGDQGVCCPKFAAQFDDFHNGKHVPDLVLIVKWVLEDWWYSDAQCHGPDVESLDIIRDVTEMLKVALESPDLYLAMVMFVSSYVHTPMDDLIRAMLFCIVAHMARPAPKYPYRMDRGSALAQVAALAAPPSMLSLPPMPRLPADYEFVGPVAPLALHPELDLADAVIDMGGLLDAEEWFTWAPVAAPAGLPAKVRSTASVTKCAAAPAAEEFGTSDAVEVVESPVVVDKKAPSASASSPSVLSRMAQCAQRLVSQIRAW
ncbi:hypothetical protein GGF32_009172 [Allomyces javanicus]|nr:hypothetical protein GGF32_009172 [Allomyces javanicus]